jgi:hypothetical protein
VSENAIKKGIKRPRKYGISGENTVFVGLLRRGWDSNPMKPSKFVDFKPFFAFYD